MVRYRRKKSEGKIAHQKTVINNITFHSKMESKYYLHLLEEMRLGNILSIDLQPSFILQDKFIVVDGVTIYGEDKNFAKIKRKSKAKTISAIKYISDFAVKYKDGSSAIIDVKGVETADFKIKKKIFLAKYPDLNFKMVIEYKKEWIDYDDYKNKLKRK